MKGCDDVFRVLRSFFLLVGRFLRTRFNTQCFYISHNTKYGYIYLSTYLSIPMVLLLLLLLLLLFQLFILLLFTSGETHRAESRHQTVVFIFFPVVGDVNVSQHFHDLLEFRSGVHISLP